MLPSYYQILPENRDEGAALTLAEAGRYPLPFARLLAARGCRTPEEADRFLNAGQQDMYDPFLMQGMDAAADRILQAMERGEKVTVYGDYDVDGITATSILLTFFRSRGFKAGFYLPDRLSEGYGINEGAVRKLAAEGTQLMITVDTGITAIAECALAAELGMDVIVTDHHECQGQLPEAAAVVDAKQPGETYPFLYLAGCGVALKLVQALCIRGGILAEMGPYFELAAVGTVADIVPLLDENRIIVREGFRRMRLPSNIGLKALMTQAGYDFKRKITAGFIGFTVAPRLNAGGRMGDASRGVKLFTTDDEALAVQIAAALERENELRRQSETQILEEVTAKIEDSPEIKSSMIMVVAGEGWHHGVIGIVSSRIKDRYWRPNILLTIEDGIASGSARSIDGFNLFEALQSCADLMLRFGGHEAAAGMKLKAENIPELTRRLNLYAREHMDAVMLTRMLTPELTLAPEEITLPLIRMIEQMEPFGQAMPEPLIRTDGVLTEIRRIGADRETVRLQVLGSRTAINAIAFRSGALADFFKANTHVRLAGNLQINAWNGYESPQLLLRALEGCESDETKALIRLFDLRQVTEDFSRYADARPRLKRNICNQVYRLLLSVCKNQHSEDTGAIHLGDIENSRPAGISLYDFLQAVLVFEELGLLKTESSGAYFRFALVRGKTAKLDESGHFRRYFED